MKHKKETCLCEGEWQFLPCGPNEMEFSWKRKRSEAVSVWQLDPGERDEAW